MQAKLLHTYSTYPRQGVPLQVISRANTSPYGLVAGVFTKDLDTANLISRSLDAGTVWINNCWHYLSASVPFGGHKESGAGMEGGQQGIEAYTKVHAPCIYGITTCAHVQHVQACYCCSCIRNAVKVLCCI